MVSIQVLQARRRNVQRLEGLHTTMETPFEWLGFGGARRNFNMFINYVVSIQALQDAAMCSVLNWITIVPPG